MLKGSVFVLFALVVYHVDATVTIGSGFYCAQIPDFLYTCLGKPRLIRDFPVECRNDSECKEMTCIFRDRGWMDGDKVNKTAVAKFFDQYVEDNPTWSVAVKHLKADCLGDHELLPQGVYLDCKPYDIMHCAKTTFIRYARPFHWENSTRCEYPRAYAKSCPVCPIPCYEKSIPYGSCNSCITLPRSFISQYFVLYRTEKYKGEEDYENKQQKD